MSLSIAIYNNLLNRVPGIKERYTIFRKKNNGKRKVLAWLYLVGLNAGYYLLRNKSIEYDSSLFPDHNKKVMIGSESSYFCKKMEEPSTLINKLQGYDVISFDVFDTLIFRKMEHPEDLFYVEQSILNYPNLKVLRKEAEHKSRERRYTENRDYEVDINEIWQTLSDMTGIDPKMGIETEWNIEKTYCYANPYFKNVVNELKEMGKTIIVCSDMYFGEQYIRELLTLNNYPEFDGYYISCDFRNSKNNGRLYAIIRNKYGKDMKYIHIGDNEYSDEKMARQNGFHSFFYPNVNEAGISYRANDMDPVIASVYAGIINSYLHCGINIKSPEFEFGFIYGGLFAVGYCQFIHEYVLNNSVEKILFFSRDGDILYKVYNLLYPDDIEKTEYVFWSRLASTKMSAKILKAHYLERMLFHKVGQNYRLKDIFDTMDLCEHEKQFYIKNKRKNYSPDTVFDDKICHEIVDFLDDNWETVCASYETELDRGKAYYKKIIGDATKVVTVDVGWVGSGAITLERIAKEIWGFNCDFSGLMAGSCAGNSQDYQATVMSISEGKLNCYMFSPSNNRDLWKKHDPTKGHNMLVELLLSSPSKSFRGFSKGMDGEEYSFSKTQENINAVEIQKGIFEFATMFKEHPLSYLKISGRDAAAPIFLLYNNPRYVDKLIEESMIRPNIE